MLLRRDIPVGGGPRSIVVADVDGDGKRDLITGNRVGMGATILRNDGFGGFTFFLDLFAGRAVEAVAVADLDGDGDVDLVTANGASSTISVFLNGGRGTFLPAREQALRVGPRSIVPADFNGDGRPDLAVADPAGSISILINRGEGLFYPDAPTSVSGGPTSVAAGDFNLDGAQDLVAVAGGRIAMLYGNGDGTFQPPNFSAYAEAPAALAVADLDADRYPDLIVAFSTAVGTLLNDGNGRLLAGPALGSISGINSVVAADYNGDGRPDVASLSSDAGAVVLFQNLLPASIKRPSPPRNLRASDTPADLGGRVTLTWQQTRVDEETGRVAAYDVFRSGARDGAYTRIATVGVSAPFLSRDSTIITRTTVDSTATVGVPLFYYMTAKDASGTASAPSAVVTATSLAQPVFNFDFSNTGLYSVGDTVTVRVSLNPLGYRLSGLSLFLDYHPRALGLLDGDPTKPGAQPFILPQTSGGAQVLENRLAGDVAGRINLSVGALSPDQNLSLEVGTLRFVALRDTVASLAISSDAAGNRRTVLIDASDGSAFSPNLPPQPASVVIRNYRVNGSVRFQGRTANLDLPVQIDLRQSNGLPLATPYAPANDQDKNRSGVQFALDGSGRFSLIQVPAGRYAVFVKAFHYLRGRVVGDSIAVGPGSPGPLLAFRWVSSAGATSNELRGGDANNDNNINLTDFGLLAKYFGAFNIADAQNPAWVADFNGDGAVNLADFSILSSNFGEQGFGQEISTKPVPPVARLNVVRSSDGDEESFRIFVEGASQVSGFSADVVYSSEEGGATRGESLSEDLLVEGEAARAQGARMWWIVRPLGQGLRVAGYVKGDPIQAKGPVEVALLRLGGRRRATLPVVQNAWVADGDGRALPALAEAVDALPRRPALFQNVPNPFNPVTEIAYDVPGAGGPAETAGAQVVLRIYNLTGQVIRTLVEAPNAPGRYRVAWDGRDDLGHPVASGVYFYRLDIGTFRDVKRMLLLR
ncbi:MAG: hypothetical protein EXS64_01425 [Candidatus Latescibacteria bacterium]|nr:hypothetical protein [Candidatus Latescibacterota bacterium]